MKTFVHTLLRFLKVKKNIDYVDSYIFPEQHDKKN